jgi:hypothetical protein
VSLYGYRQEGEKSMEYFKIEVRDGQARVLPILRAAEALLADAASTPTQ